MDWQGLEEWTVWVGAVLLGVVILNFVIKRVLGALEKRCIRKERFSCHFFAALSLPLRVLIWVIGATVIVDLSYDLLVGQEPVIAMGQLRRVAAILALVWLIFLWKRAIEGVFRARARVGTFPLDITQLDVISKLITLLITVAALVVILPFLGVDTRAVIAIGGFGTLAVGFAGKDVFANFFSGLMLYFTQPFRIGDSIDSPAHQWEGQVEKIGWYLTSIRGHDKKVIYVPNALFSQSVLVNVTRIDCWRIRETFHLRYEDIDRVQKITGEISQMLLNHPQIDPSLRVVVALSGYGTYGLEVLMQAYTTTKDWSEYVKIQEDVLVRCSQIVVENGAKFALSLITPQK
jgi:MscS family membrane protein